MDTKCDVIKDLLPLYIDEICSEESRLIVASHLNTCEDCKKTYDLLKSPMAFENAAPNNEFEKQQVESLKKVHKKQKRKKTLIVILSVLGGIFLSLIVFYALLFAGIVAILGFNIALSKPKTYTDISKYEEYVHAAEYDVEVFAGNGSVILPETITSDMNVTDFQYTYYNPWDPQYVLYLSVEYDDAAYEAEIERLEAIGVEDYRDFYSVTDEPSNYDIIAMDSDDYRGFIYAMIPENSSDNRIVYVGIIFCNYFLDLDIHDYLPDEYLLEGFDATLNNPYKEEMVSRNRIEE